MSKGNIKFVNKAVNAKFESRGSHRMKYLLFKKDDNFMLANKKISFFEAKEKLGESNIEVNGEHSKHFMKNIIEEPRVDILNSLKCRNQHLI